MKEKTTKQERVDIMNCFFEIYKLFPHFFISLHSKNMLSKNTNIQPILTLIKLNQLVFSGKELDLYNNTISVKIINKLFKLFEHILTTIDKSKETGKGIFDYEIFTKKNKRFYIFKDIQNEYTLKYYFIIGIDGYCYRQQVKFYKKGIKLSDNTTIRNLKSFLQFMKSEEKEVAEQTIESLERYYALFLMWKD